MSTQDKIVRPGGLPMNEAVPSSPAVGIPDAVCAECERLREEIADYIGHRTDSVAGRYWAALFMISRFESELDDMVGEFDRITTDDYDQSLELHGCAENMRLNAEQQAFIRDAGFARVWLNHGEKKDNCWETYYQLTGDLPYRGWRKRYVVDSTVSSTRVLAGPAENGYFEISHWPEGWGPQEGNADIARGYYRIVPDPIAQGMSAEGQDPQGLGATPASPVGSADAPEGGSHA